MIEYIGKKVVHAEYMNECEAVELGYARPNEDNHEWREGYHVVYEEGYHSWSPKDVFEKAYKASETFLDRLHIEADELAEKQAKLNTFIGSDKFKELSWEHQRLLEAQFGAMLAYLTTLQLRIELLTPVHCNGAECCCKNCPSHRGRHPQKQVVICKRKNSYEIS